MIEIYVVKNQPGFKSFVKYDWYDNEKVVVEHSEKNGLLSEISQKSDTSQQSKVANQRVLLDCFGRCNIHFQLSILLRPRNDGRLGLYNIFFYSTTFQGLAMTVR